MDYHLRFWLSTRYPMIKPEGFSAFADNELPRVDTEGEDQNLML